MKKKILWVFEYEELTNKDACRLGDFVMDYLEISAVRLFEMLYSRS